MGIVSKGIKYTKESGGYISEDPKTITDKSLKEFLDKYIIEEEGKRVIRVPTATGVSNEEGCVVELFVWGRQHLARYRGTLMKKIPEWRWLKWGYEDVEKLCDPEEDKLYESPSKIK